MKIHGPTLGDVADNSSPVVVVRDKAGDRDDNGFVAYDEQLADRIRELLEIEPGVTEMKMFGGLAFLIDGHMTVVASGGGGVMLRVDPDEAIELATHPHAGPMVMKGREMRGWLRVDAEGVSTRDELGDWVDRGVDHVRTLPPKTGTL